MKAINPYLNFPGNSEEAFNFYRSVFGGEFLNIQRFKDTPEGPKVSEKEKDMLMHISLPVGKGNVMMATDTLDSLGQKLTVGNNITLSIETESKAEAEKIFNGLSAGGKVTMPLQDTFWKAYFGMVNDKYGIHWMVSYTNPNV
jgi:PhnB protein